MTRGKAALLTMARERPHEFAKLGAAFVPKEFTFETIATELDDEELRRMIQAMRQQLNNQEAAALPARKVIDHVN